MRHSPLLRTATLALLVTTVLAASGCSWFRKNSPYQQSAEARPLEVPPDLDSPNTAGALGAATSVTRSSMSGTPVAGQNMAGQGMAGQTPDATGAAMPAAAAPAAMPAGNTGFTVAGEQEAVFAKLGEALGAIEGVTIASKAQLLGTYDVSYEGSNFLVRSSKVDAGVYVSAVDPRGVAASGEAPGKLIAALKAAMGGG